CSPSGAPRWRPPSARGSRWTGSDRCRRRCGPTPRWPPPRTPGRSAPSRRPPSLVALLVMLVAALLAGCAHFPDSGPRNWRDKPDSTGLLAAPPKVPDPDPEETPPREAKPPGEIPPPNGCEDQDPLVVATCLDPVSAV